MNDSRKPGITIIEIARVVSAAFLALIVVGPSPFGHLMLAFNTYEPIASIPLIVFYHFVLGGVTGAVAGMRLAWIASILCALWANHHTILVRLLETPQRPISDFVLSGIVVGVLGACAIASGIIGALISTRLGIERIGERPSSWLALSLIAVCSLVYAYAGGIARAEATLKWEPARIVSKDAKPEMDAHVTGIFPTVNIGPCSVDTREWFFGACSYTYYTDPTGRIRVGRLRVLED